MKRIQYLLLLLLVFISCKENGSDSVIQLQPGSLMFTIPGINENSGKISEVLSSVSYMIKRENNDLIEGSLELIPFNESYISSPLELELGGYELIEFIILNEDGYAVYICPKEESDLSHLIEDPLPIPFTIAPNEKTTLIPEVVTVAGYDPKVFGYGTFQFSIVDPLLVNINTTIASFNEIDPIIFHLKVVARNIEGESQWDNIFQLTSGNSQIIIPENHHLYSFSASVDENGESFIDHNQQHLGIDLVNDNNLAFEFLPSDLSSIGVKKLLNHDGSPTNGYDIYFSTDPCQMYLRLDVNEPLANIQPYVDGYFADENGGALTLNLSNSFDSYDKNRWAINLWNAKPFSESDNRCEMIFGNPEIPEIHNGMEVAYLNSVVMAFLESGPVVEFIIIPVE